MDHVNQLPLVVIDRFLYLGEHAQTVQLIQDSRMEQMVKDVQLMIAQVVK